MTVADRIKFLRETQGMSQETLANKIGLKDKSSIAKIEKSGDKITLKNVEKLSEALNCSPAYLMGWSDEKYPEMAHERVTKVRAVEDYVDKIVPKTENEREIIDLYSQLTKEQQQLVRNTMKAFLQKQ